ncbi:F0F1 ATP synthase subunit epsilon [Pseudodonghicola flavimaris]|uniref:ATP synthase epsilon chain n=1 Tax=Pseudodonghicola flavimaris TaxID=3050036 RepID=A0ABT7F5R6_9RHOB|nr:F0F1 ATP synthase subunit epsilon [Pseudodonghicola flavimaris]MDK3019951.1 F0F1 ATP synthase subunit epsilon [Pseudodonghicola flavimaris]
MKLVVTTPTSVVTTVEDVAHVRAEDASGAFGILPGHADFVTVLPTSVVTWRDRAGKEGFVVVRGGVLTVRDGAVTEIAARGAASDRDISTLGKVALEQMEKSEETEEGSWTADTRLHLAAMRQIERVLQAQRGADMPLPRLDAGTRGGGEGAGV